jgi:hypothetical protein
MKVSPGRQPPLRRGELSATATAPVALSWSRSSHTRSCDLAAMSPCSAPCWSPLVRAAFASDTNALYRSPQVPVLDSEDTIVSFAHTHGRLAIVPALKTSANRMRGTLYIKNSTTQAMCPQPTPANPANSTRLILPSLRSAKAKCSCLQNTRRKPAGCGFGLVR